MNILVANPPNQKVKNVVRDLLYGCWCAGRRIGGMQMPPLNLLYAATTLKQAGHQVTVLDGLFDEALYEEVKKRFSTFDIVAVLSSTNSFKADVEFLQDIKQIHPRIISVVFGSHASFMPEHCLNEPAVDIIIRREPEMILRNLVATLESQGPLDQVRGIGYKENNRHMLTELFPFIENLDDLPIADRSLLSQRVDYFNPVVQNVPYTTMQTSRGCPARCNFCTVPSFYGKKIRYRSAESVLTELRMLTQMGYREIFFRDETFSVYQDRNRAICQGMIDENLNLSWICNARVDMIDEQDLALMKKAGCHLVKFGVESGDQEILDRIKKGITLEDTRRAFDICHRLNIDTHAHVMLGCPGETVDTIRRTITFVKEIDPGFVSFGIHTPYPGTELFSQVVTSQPEIFDGSGASMDKLHVKGFFNESFTDLSKEDLERWVKRAYRSFYFRPAYLFKRLFMIQNIGQFVRFLIAGSNIFSFSVERES